MAAALEHPTSLTWIGHSSFLCRLAGVAFLVGRMLYFRAYSRDAEKRGPGMILSFAANVVLVLGGLIGGLIAIL